MFSPPAPSLRHNLQIEVVRLVHKHIFSSGTDKNHDPTRMRWAVLDNINKTPKKSNISEWETPEDVAIRWSETVLRYERWPASSDGSAFAETSTSSTTREWQKSITSSTRDEPGSKRQKIKINNNL